MSTLKWSLKFALITLGLFAVLARSAVSSVLYEEHFDTDVVGSGDWQPTDGSISVDLDSGWLHISADVSGSDSHAGKVVSLTLPITIEARTRLVSGGNNYTQPWLLFYFGPTTFDAIITSYLPGASYGWHFGTDNQWTDIHTKGPQTENTWITIRATIDTDGGVLYARSDSESVFTTISTRSWSIPGSIDSIEFRQPWNAVCDLDFIRITGPDDPANWCDDFEVYTPNSLPFPPWLDGEGNTVGISVDATVAHSGTSSLKMFGQLGNCWGATTAKPHAGLPILVSLSVRNGNEELTGCHPQRAMLTLRSGGPHWSNCPCPPIYRFLENGDLEVNIPPESPTVFSGFALEEWHQVTCYLWMPNDGQLHVKLWTNGILQGEFTMAEESWMAEPGYLDISSQEGTAWFDDVCVTAIDQCVPDVVIDTVQAIACGGSEEDVNNDNAVDVLDVVQTVSAAFRGVAETPDSCNAVFIIP